MSTALAPIQVAVYDALVSGVTLCSVFDYVPQGTAMPYIVINEKSESEKKVLGYDIQDATVSLSVWSDALGDGEALAILVELRAALDNASLSVSGFTYLRCVHEFTNTLRTATERQIVVQYRVQAR